MCTLKIDEKNPFLACLLLFPNIRILVPLSLFTLSLLRPDLPLQWFPQGILIFTNLFIYTDYKQNEFCPYNRKTCNPESRCKVVSKENDTASEFGIVRERSMKKQKAEASLRSRDWNRRGKKLHVNRPAQHVLLTTKLVLILWCYQDEHSHLPQNCSHSLL